MRLLSLFVIYLIGLLATNAQPQVLKTTIDVQGINTFFDISPSKNYIIFSKNLKGFDSGDYIEGLLYIYNKNANSYELLSKDTLEISSAIIRWGADDNTLFFFDGRSLFYISIKDEILVKPIYTPAFEYMRIDNFFISTDNNKIACWISNNKPNEETKDLIIIDLKSNLTKMIYTVKNDWLPEHIKSDVEWANDGNTVYFINMYGKLFQGDVQSGIIIQLKDSVEPDFLRTKNNYLYFTRKDELVMYNLNNNKEKVILNANRLKINYLAANDDSSCVISFNNKVILYNGYKPLVEVLYTSHQNASIVYCDSNIFIEEEILNDDKIINVYEYEP